MGDVEMHSISASCRNHANFYSRQADKETRTSEDPPSVLSSLGEPNQICSPIQTRPHIDKSSSSLERIRHGYNVMTRVRKLAELSVRPRDKWVHQLAIDLNSYPLIPATQQYGLAMSQILHSSLFDFASIAFPEFVSLDSIQKWKIICGCSHRVNYFESIFRAAKLFPDENQMFVSYTTTLSSSSVDLFLSDCGSDLDREMLAGSFKKILENNVAKYKQMMVEVAPTEEEFLLMLSYIFWNTESLTEDPISASVRASIMDEFHSYYISTERINYAKRLGQILCLMVENEKLSLTITKSILDRLRIEECLN